MSDAIVRDQIRYWQELCTRIELELQLRLVNEQHSRCRHAHALTPTHARTRHQQTRARKHTGNAAVMPSALTHGLCSRPPRADALLRTDSYVVPGRPHHASLLRPSGFRWGLRDRRLTMQLTDEINALKAERRGGPS